MRPGQIGRRELAVARGDARHVVPRIRRAPSRSAACASRPIVGRRLPMTSRTFVDGFPVAPGTPVRWDERPTAADGRAPRRCRRWFPPAPMPAASHTASAGCRRWRGSRCSRSASRPRHSPSCSASFASTPPPSAGRRSLVAGGDRLLPRRPQGHRGPLPSRVARLLALRVAGGHRPLHPRPRRVPRSPSGVGALLALGPTLRAAPIKVVFNVANYLFLASVSLLVFAVFASPGGAPGLGRLPRRVRRVAGGDPASER